MNFVGVKLAQRSWVGLSMVAAAATGCGGSSGPGAVVVARQLDPAAVGQKAIELYDADKSGGIEAAELKKSPALENALGRIDANKDGAILPTKSRHASSSIKSNPTSCRSSCDWSAAAPVSGASVMLTPDPVLGEGTVAFQGVSDESGSVALAPPEGISLPGFPVGLYTVKVTGPLDATKGCEVAEDVPESLRMTLCARASQSSLEPIGSTRQLIAELLAIRPRRHSHHVLEHHVQVLGVGDAHLVGDRRQLVIGVGEQFLDPPNPLAVDLRLDRAAHAAHEPPFQARSARSARRPRRGPR